MKAMHLTALVLVSLLAATARAGSSEDTVPVKLTGDAGPSATPQDAVMDVVATGVGLDPEKARQNAFSNAIEQAVGVLVDAETIVKNDRLVDEKVLTFSRGFVRQFDIVREWQKGKLHFARIRAQVALTPLTEKLKASKIDVCEVYGARFYHQIKHEIASAEHAGEMLDKALTDFEFTKLVDVSLAGKPKVKKRTEDKVTLTVRAKLTVDTAKWRQISASVKPLLQRIASAHRGVRCERAIDSHEVSTRLTKELPDKVALFFFGRRTSSGKFTYWDVFIVPRTVGDVVADCAKRRYHLRIALLNTKDEVVLEEKRPLCGTWSIPLTLAYNLQQWHAIGPLLFGAARGANTFAPSLTVEHDVEVPTEKLKDIAKCAVSIEEVQDQ